MKVITREETNRLLDLLGQETEIFKQMLKLTEHQTELIEADEIDEFNASLDNRQELIEKINGLHQESQLLMQSYIAYTGASGGKSILTIDAASEKLRELVTACARLNEKNAATAKERAKNYAERSGKISTSRKGLTSYIQNVSRESEIFDKMT